MSKDVKLTCDSGKLVPCYTAEILPGDTVEMYMNALIRMTTPIYPVMDQAYADFYAFFTPYRILYDNWVNLRGENSNTYWETPTEHFTPQITAPENGWSVGSMADHLGIPPLIDGFSVSVLPFRAVGMIWNEWFRSESLTQPISIPHDEITVAGENGTWADYVTKGYLGGECLRVARLHDVFSSGLLEPQAGDPVSLPITTTDAYAPVVSLDPTKVKNPYVGADGKPLPIGAGIRYGTLRHGDHILPGLTGGTDETHNLVINYETGYVRENSQATSSTYGTHNWLPTNEFADLSETVGVGVTVNDLRMAFVTQQVLESLNRGNRYTEILANMWHIESPDARLQRPEFLGSKRVPINMAEINQTSSTDATSPLGHPGANSKTFDEDLTPMFTKSFLEDGVLQVFLVIRPAHTYCQGVAPFWRKRERWDYFYPMMNGLGDRPIPNSMIYLQSDSVVDADGNVVNDLPFAYQTPWFEYKNDFDECHGLMRTYVPNSLSVWNYADNYSELPTLSTGWLYEDGSQIGRTLAVQNQPQFIADVFFDPIYVRAISISDLPGLTRL